jgi:hypothetical protein
MEFIQIFFKIECLMKLSSQSEPYKERKCIIHNLFMNYIIICFNYALEDNTVTMLFNNQLGS